MATLGKLTCAGKSGGTSTNYGDLLACKFRWRKRTYSRCVYVVHRVPLQAANGDRFVLGPEDARPFAQFLYRTHARAGGPEQIGFKNGSRRAQQIFRRDFLDEFGYV